ncbi:hypothetical protein [Oceaniferula spumae]
MNAFAIPTLSLFTAIAIISGLNAQPSRTDLFKQNLSPAHYLAISEFLKDSPEKLKHYRAKPGQTCTQDEAVTELTRFYQSEHKSKKLFEPDSLQRLQSHIDKLKQQLAKAKAANAKTDQKVAASQAKEHKELTSKLQEAEVKLSEYEKQAASYERELSVKTPKLEKLKAAAENAETKAAKASNDEALARKKNDDAAIAKTREAWKLANKEARDRQETYAKGRKIIAELRAQLENSGAHAKLKKREIAMYKQRLKETSGDPTPPSIYQNFEASIKGKQRQLDHNSFLLLRYQSARSFLEKRGVKFDEQGALLTQ